MFIKSKLLSVAFVAALLFSGCGDDSSDSTPAANTGAAAGATAPATSLPIIGETTLVTTSGEILHVYETAAGIIVQGYEGKIVLLEVYGDTCPHCIADIPMYNSIQAKYGNDVVVIAIESYGRLNSAQMQNFAATNGIQYRTVAKENSGNIIAHAESIVGPMGGVPYLVIFDREGEVYTSGLNAFNEAQLDAIIQGL